MWDSEAENMVLAAALDLEREDYLITVVSDCTEEDFSDNRRKVWECVKELYDNGARPGEKYKIRSGELLRALKEKGIDGIKVHEYIKELGRVEVGDLSMWTERLKTATKRRALSLWMDKLKGTIANNTISIDSAITQAAEGLYEIAAMGQQMTIYSGKEISRRAMERYEQRKANPQQSVGILTGIPKLDKFFRGMKSGDLIVVTAPTGGGKTTITQNIALRASKTATGLYLSSEMPEDQMGDKFATIEAGVTSDDVTDGTLTPEDEKAFLDALARIYDSGLNLVECVDMSIENITSIARKFKITTDLKVLYVDYIGRMEMDIQLSKGLKEYQVLEMIARRCKKLAQRLEIAVVLLVQLTEEGYLQGSKRIKNECDLVVKLLPLDEEEQKEHPGVTHWLEVEKNRRGPEGNIPMKWEKKRLRIGEAAV